MRPLWRLLWRKTRRDLARGWRLQLAAALLAAVGAFFLATAATAVAGVDRACQVAYARLGFMDFSVRLREPAPPGTVERLRSIPGIAAASGRRCERMHLETADGRDYAATVLGLSEGQEVNDVLVQEGRRAGRGELLMERRFARAHGIRVGDPVRVRGVAGDARLPVVGLVSSPEWIWYVVDRFDPRPAMKHAIVFVPSSDTAELADQPGINEVLVRVREPQQAERVSRQVFQALAAFRPRLPVLRGRQPSHAALLRDRRILGATLVPVASAALGWSCLLVFLATWHVVDGQRRELSGLIALGVQPRTVALHVVFGTAVVVGCGAVLGVLGGSAAGLAATTIYRDAFALPFLEPAVPWGALAAAFLASLGAGVAAAWTCAGRITHLEVAQALNPEFSHSAGGQGRPRRLPAPGALLLNLAVRNLLRSPGRSALGVVGMSVAVVLLTLVLGWWSGQRRAIDLHLSQVHRWDLHALMRRTDAGGLPRTDLWAGVLRSEGYLRLYGEVAGPGGSTPLEIWG
ncbi:MAG: FtsX-like permease family protein, partial [Candidatus Eremiobacterota bacterium]